jgi:hypothetical protein
MKLNRENLACSLQFKDLREGDVFCFDSYDPSRSETSIRMKTNTIREGGSVLANSVELSSGVCILTPINTFVRLIHAEVILKLVI